MKKAVSILLAVIFVVALMPSALAADETFVNPTTVSNEAELVAAVAADATYDKVTLTNDITLTSTLTIGHGVFISGDTAKHTITYAGNASDGAVAVNTPEAVTMDSLVLDCTNINSRGVKLNTNSPKFTFSNSVMNVNLRGIWMNSDLNADSSSVINVTNSYIQNNQLPSDKTYQNWANCSDTRGLSLWDLNNSRVNITGSHILGFGYTINLAGDMVDGLRNYNGSIISISGSELWGWSALNIWSCGTTFNISNSDLRGINMHTSGANNFATIVLNEEIYGTSGPANYINISGGKIGAYSYGGLDQYPIRIDSELNTYFAFSLGSDFSYVTFESNVNQVMLNLTTPNLTNQMIEDYLNGYFSGAEFCDTSGLEPIQTRSVA